MITRFRRSKLLSRPYYKGKLQRDIGIFRAIRQKLAREQQKTPPVSLNTMRGQPDQGCE